MGTVTHHGWSKPGDDIPQPVGIVMGRTGNRLDASAPRNAYLTADGRWVALSPVEMKALWSGM